MKEETAKLFWSDCCQAVRLPKEYRFVGEEVRIRRHGAAVILEPLPKDWSWSDAVSDPLDPDMIETAREQPPQQERPDLDKLFPE